MEVQATEVKPIWEKYKGYPLSVILYHLYDLYFEDYLKYSKEELHEYAQRSKIAKTVILSRMNEDEYNELQRSLRGCVIQARISVSKEYKFIKTIYDPERIEMIRKLLDSEADSNDTLPVEEEDGYAED